MSEKNLRKMKNLLEKGQKFAVATIISTEGSSPRSAGAKMIIKENGSTEGSIGGDYAEEAVVDRALNALNEGEKYCKMELSLEEEEEGGVGMKCGGKMEVFIEVIEPSEKLVIIGGGKVPAAIAKIAKNLDFGLIIIDPHAENNDFPKTAKVISKQVDEGFEEINISTNSYIVIASRHEHDEAALINSLKTDAKYIGMLGSENRVRSTFEYLQEEESIEKEKLDKINAPIGLDIGSETPEEIAISILAEIIKERRDSEVPGESLKLDY